MKLKTKNSIEKSAGIIQLPGFSGMCLTGGKCKCSHWFQEKCKNIRRGISPENSKYLLIAVQIANDQNIEGFPKTIFSNSVQINKTDMPDAVASFF